MTASLHSHDLRVCMFLQALYVFMHFFDGLRFRICHDRFQAVLLRGGVLMGKTAFIQIYVEVVQEVLDSSFSN